MAVSWFGPRPCATARGREARARFPYRDTNSGERWNNDSKWERRVSIK